MVGVTRAAVLGSGSWGTTYATVLADGGSDVTLWSRRPEVAEAVRGRHENPDYLPGIRLPDRLAATADPAEAVAGADFVVLALPAQSLRDNLEKWVPLLPAQALLVSLIKGIELGTTKRMSEVIAEVADIPARRVVVVSGPNLAHEIAARHPAATVVAGTDEAACERLQRATLTPYFRPYTNDDVIGCELGGAVKNVVAIACGMADGMGFGDNTKAGLVTRGLAEMARLGAALGADPLTFSGLAGLGDLVATCVSPLSRNRAFGVRLGRGASFADVLAESWQTVEGVQSCESILALARRHGVDMPITEHVVQVVHRGMSPTRMLESLMARETRPERRSRRRSRR